MADIHSVNDYETQHTLETFSFLTKLTQDDIYEQVAFILAQGWTPSIEHVDPRDATDHYWAMWKLPFFGEQNPEAVIAELDACHRAYPGHHVRLVGYDNYMQTMGTAFVVYEGRG